MLLQSVQAGGWRDRGRDAGAGGGGGSQRASTDHGRGAVGEATARYTKEEIDGARERLTGLTSWRHVLRRSDLGYASEVLQNDLGLNRVKQDWVMMFPRANNAPWQGSGKEQT